MEHSEYGKCCQIITGVYKIGYSHSFRAMTRVRRKKVYRVCFLLSSAGETSNSKNAFRLYPQLQKEKPTGSFRFLSNSIHPLYSILLQ